MDKNLLQSLFLRARDQYESSVRWGFLFGILLIFFHGLIFSQFIQLENQRSEIDIVMDRLQAQSQAITALTEQLNSLEKNLTGQLDFMFNKLFVEMRQDFTVLNRAVDAIRSSPDSELGADFLPLPDSSSIVVQTPLDNEGENRIVSELLADKALQHKIGNATTEEELRTLLQPFVETVILEPRFKSLNQEWRTQLLPEIEAQHEELMTLIQEQDTLFQEGDEGWQAIREEITQMVQMAQDLKLESPTEAFWWSTTTGKRSELGAIELDVEDQLTIETELLSELQETVQNMLLQQQELQQAVQEEIKIVEENFQLLQQKLATLGQPLDIIPLDLNFVVARFPLILGVSLAAIFIWPTYRLNELAWTVGMMGQENQIGLRDWLFMRLPFHFSDRLKKSSCLRLDIGGLILLLLFWIGMAGWQLIGWKDIQATDSMGLAFWGGLAMMLGQAYRWRVICQARSLWLDKKVN